MREAESGAGKALVLSDVQVPTVAQERGIDPATWNVLTNTIYPGASAQMVVLAVDYCRSRQLDIMKKPVHIVPVWDSKQRRMVETIWPGISEVRTTASRTKSYAGKDDPVFGPDITATFGRVKVTYPEWCKVTVYKMVDGQRCPYTETVFWREACAMVKEKVGDRVTGHMVPNSMWQKRTRGQLAKCAEAAALRSAFPEELGGSYTAEEMRGQAVNGDFGGQEFPSPAGAAAVERAIEVARGGGRSALVQFVDTLAPDERAAVREQWRAISEEADKAPQVTDVEVEEVDDPCPGKMTDERYDALCDAIDNAQTREDLEAAVSGAVFEADEATEELFRKRGRTRWKEIGAA